MEEGLKTIAPHQALDLLHQLDRGEPPSWATVAPSPTTTPSVGGIDEGGGSSLYDPDGTVRCLDESSGATFLDELKQFMLTLMDSLKSEPGFEDDPIFVASVGSYQNCALTNPKVDPFWRSELLEMIQMLYELRQYIKDGNGAFKSGGIQWWGNLSKAAAYAGPSSIIGLTTDERYRCLVFYHACFALSVSIGYASWQLPEHQYGDACFERARMLLGNSMDSVRFTLTDMSALSLME